MSSDQQNERSPDQQFQTIAGTLQRLGRPWVHVQDYRDVGVSGRRHDGRPGFMAMLEDIASGRVRVDAILVENLDRFGRNDVSLASRQSLARDHGVLVLTADANFSDPDTPQGQAFGFIESIRATGESRVRAMYVLRGKKDSAQRGRWPGGPFPVGYRPKPVLEERGNGRVVKSSLLEVDPVGAAVVRLAFQAAYEQGWGQDRIAAHLNERPDVPEEFKPVRGSTIGRILDRELYIGTLAWNSVCTDIVADHRVTQRNPEDEIIRIPGFCEPIVEREVWEAVRRMRQERGTPGRKARRERDPFAGKEIQPTTPGGALQYPLTGLVVCAVCGSAMIANGGGAYRPASGEVRRYVRYVCPGRVCRACPNAVRIPEPKLREAVVDRLRRRLLPIPDEELGGSARLNASMVENCQWFQELLAETQREAERLSQADGPELPAVEAALAVLEERRVGWRQSLGNSKLAPAVREELEAAAAADAAERERLEGRRRDLLQAAERNRRLITAADVAERLNRLAEMLAGGNATLANIVLAEHIERIEVHPDGRVVMRTCRLGSVEGVADLFADEAADAASAPATVGTPRVRPRRRSRRRTGDAVPSGVA
ncbi:MAG TPA: recombinase family protein, partial [Pirellulales bacterium]